MSPRRVSADPLDRSTFPVDPWRLTEIRHVDEGRGAAETFFAVGNGYLGLRANPEEGRYAYRHGTFINGFHETWPIRHAEEAFGFAETGQTIVNVPDPKIIKLYVDDEPLLLSEANLDHYERSLDFRDGILRRELIWTTPSGKRVKVSSTRMVSFTDRHVALMTFEVEMLEGSAPVVISSQLLNRQDGWDDYQVRTAHTRAAGEDAPDFDPRKAAAFEGRVLLPRLHEHTGRMMLGYECKNSGMTLAVGADHVFETENEYTVTQTAEPDLAKSVYRIAARPGVQLGCA